MGLDLPPIVGDPAGMRALADSLRGSAAQLGTFAAELRSFLKGMAFEGPAADEFGGNMDAYAARLEAGGDRLEALAARLYAAAAEVERQLLERKLLLERMAEQRAGVGSP